MRALVRLFVWAVVSVCVAASWSAVIGQGSCPPELARLMPSDAAEVTGHLNEAGAIALGSAAADLPFDHPCIRSTKYPARLTFDIKQYRGDALKLFRMQIDGEEQQRLQNGRQELERRHKQVRNPVSINPVTTETVAGGTMVYFDYTTDCSEGTPRSKPTVHLLAVAHKDGSAINVTIEGNMTASAAKNAAAQVLRNFATAGTQEE